MAVSQRLELRPSQSLVMTPQLQQAIKLLQLSNLELSAYVAEELERNPLLERDERAEAEGRDDTAETGADESRRGDEDDLDDRSGDSDWRDAPDAFADAPPTPSGGGTAADDPDELTSLEQRVAAQTNLRDHLLEQAILTFTDPGERAIAETLIDSLDEAGYLASPVEELASLLGVEDALVERVLIRMQGFDPLGVFARNLAECLAIQLRERDRLDPAMQALLDNLELLGRRDLAALRRICSVDAEDLADMMAELRQLDPRPASTFGAGPVQPLVPDILMQARRDGGWQIELNPATLPRVLVNNRYYVEIAAGARDKDSKSYLSERLQAANWLARALDQRAQTIIKVSSAIVARQNAFFVHGVQHLKPLTLREIAETIEMHESTVSRVTANKYIATPRGTYELKYFFTASIQGSDGESHSAEAVRDRIKKLIDAEHPDKVLSDDRIVAILRGDGIDIARRTVAKYREALRIPSSVQRKREKATSA